MYSTQVYLWYEEVSWEALLLYDIWLFWGSSGSASLARIGIYLRSGTGMYSPIPGIESGEEAWGEQLTPPAQFFNRDDTNALTRLPIL